MPDGTNVWHSYLAPILVEFYGTFFLTFVANIAGAKALDPDTMQYETAAHTPALAVGMVLAILVYSGGHISGGHYNPAVTFGILLRGKISFSMALLYFVSQMLAGMTGGCVGTYLTGQMAYPYVDGDGLGKAVAMSILFSFLLVQTVLSTATSKAILGNQWFGLTIGMVVFVFATCAATFPGSVVNPAVSSGMYFAAFTMDETTIGGAYDGTEHSPVKYTAGAYWNCLVSPMIGALFAAAWYRVTSPKEFGTKKHGLPPSGHVHQNLEHSKITDVLAGGGNDSKNENAPLKS